jgi:hypothetical protein
MRNRCGQSKDVSSMQPIDGITYRAWGYCRRVRWTVAPWKEERGEGAVILRKVSREGQSCSLKKSREEEEGERE